jgi:hypothetical protein
MTTIKNLDALLKIITSDDDLELRHGLDICMLPTFGGDEPGSTHGVWSWDETRLIIGAGRADFKIVNRADYE